MEKVSENKKKINNWIILIIYSGEWREMGIILKIIGSSRCLANLKGLIN